MSDLDNIDIYEWMFNLYWKLLQMPAYLEILSGVKGVVQTSDGMPVQGAEIEIIGRNHPTKTTAQGEFWRLLLPGSYQIKVNGYS